MLKTINSLLCIACLPGMAFSGNPCSSIPVLEGIVSKGEFEKKYKKTFQPVVFKGAARDWDSSSWSLEFFKENFSEVPVEIQVRETLSDNKYGAVESEYEQKTLAEYIQDIDSRGIEAGYLSQFNILDIHPELQEGLKYPKFYASEYLKLINIWIGPKGTKSKLHYDSDHNLFVQIFGKKKITLIAPAYSEQCYAVNITWYDGYSPIDVENPDYVKYPEFERVPLLQYELEPGDMLYIPKGWWHDIRSTENSISANLWWIGWMDFIKESVGQLKYQYIDGKEFDNKNSYWHTFKKNIGLSKE